MLTFVSVYSKCFALPNLAKCKRTVSFLFGTWTYAASRYNLMRNEHISPICWSHIDHLLIIVRLNLMLSMKDFVPKRLVTVLLFSLVCNCWIPMMIKVQHHHQLFGAMAMPPNYYVHFSQNFLHGIEPLHGSTKDVRRGFDRRLQTGFSLLEFCVTKGVFWSKKKKSMAELLHIWSQYERATIVYFDILWCRFSYWTWFEFKMNYKPYFWVVFKVCTYGLTRMDGVKPYRKCLLWCCINELSIKYWIIRSNYPH